MKKIGIVSWKTGGNSFGVTLPYIYHFEQFGEIVLLKHDEPVRFDLDLVIVPGGPDVNPERYNKKPGLLTGSPCNFREYFDKAILPQYIENNIPIFGVCRGLQTVAVHFGAELDQHMDHETNDPKERWDVVHNVVFRASKESYKVVPVNSIHHQTVSDFNFPKELKVIGRYLPEKVKQVAEMGPIEAIVHRTSPIALVQFHPEEL